MNSLRRHISLTATNSFSLTTTYKISAKQTLFPLLKSMASEFSTASLKVEHEVQKSRFVIKLGKDEAFLEYKEDPPGVFDLEHTFVPTSLRGKGIAELLAKEAFDYIVKNDKKMILTCSYLQKFGEKNSKPEYKKCTVPR